MKTAVFGDIHGNFTAWQQAFSIMQKYNVDKFLCTGDLVGYGPQPDKVVADIQNKIESGLNLKVVTGNHDRGAVDNSSLSRFNAHAKEALLWTRNQLSAANKQFLNDLPQIIETDNLILTHGTPNNPIWEYIRPWTAADIFADYQFNCCFVGHTHLLQLFIKEGSGFHPKEKSISTPTTVNLNASQRLIVNVGSIGQPRDGNPHSSFIIWDDSAHTLEVIRFEYNVKQVQKLIRSSDLPAMEADRLAKGR